MKGKSLLKLLGAIVLAIVLTLAFVPGCAKEAPAPVPEEPTPVPEEPTPAPEEPTPAPAAEVIKWRFQPVFSSGHTDWPLCQQVCDDIWVASNHRLKIELYPGGTLAGSMEAFQACGEGVFEVHMSWPVYLRGVDFGFQAIGSGNMDMEAIDKYVWLYEAGGWEIAERAFEGVNLKFVAAAVWGTEVMNANKPIYKLEDLRGLKFRTSDPRLCEKHGIAAITLPLEEVFTALVTGAVDVVEFGHLDFNEGLGVTEVTKYSIYPDWWNVENLTAVVVNLDAWNALPEDLQKIVEMCFRGMELHHYTATQYASAVLQKRMLEEGTMEFIRMAPEGFAQMRADMLEIEQSDIEEHGGLTREVYESYYEFKDIWFPYKQMARWWGWDVTPEQAK